MPWVEVYRDPRYISDDTLQMIVASLPPIVAQAMDVPGEPDGRLTSKDIEVKTFDFNKFDIYNLPLAIIIRAEDFPARRANLEDRIDEIVDFIKSIPSAHGFVWVRPVEGKFKEF